MASERDSHLINNGIVRSYNTTELYCILCESDTSYATCTKHLTSLLHQQNLQWFSLLFQTSGNNIKCAICNNVIAWGQVKIHSKAHIKIPWSMPDDSYDKYKIFFENQIFEWNNLFHCCLCDTTFSSCDLALIHITNLKHQSHKEKTPMENNFLTTISVPWISLVCEGLVAFNAKELRCRFCNCKSVTLSSVGRHIKGLMHLCNKSSFQLKLKDSEMTNLVSTVFPENLEPEVHDLVQNELELKDSEMSNLVSTVFPENLEPEVHNFAQNEDIVSATNNFEVKEKTPEVHLKLDYIFKQNDLTSCCIICNRIILNNAKNDHTTEINHVDALKRYGCEAITQKNANDFHCAHCDCMISSTENLLRHIRGKKHLKTMKTITEERENNVEKFSTELHPEFSLRQNSPCNYIVKLNDTDLQCRVCDCIIKSATINEKVHLGGKQHAKSLKKYGCERIIFRGENIYHCEYCDVIISHTENVYNHIKEASHINSLTMAINRNSVNTIKFLSQEEKSQEISIGQMTEIASGNETLRETANVQQLEIPTRKTTDVWLKQIASNTKTSQINSDVQKKNLTSEKISKMTDHSLAFHHILKLGNVMFYCRICDCNIFSNLTLKAHIAGKLHVESHEHFFNYISMIMKDKYYCKCCHITIYGTDDVYTHLHGNKHKKKIDEFVITNTSIRAKMHENEKSFHAVDEYHQNKNSDIAISHPEDVGLNIKKTSHTNSITVTENRHRDATINITSNAKFPRENLNVRAINISSKAGDSKENCPEVQMMKVSNGKETSSEASDVRAMKKARKFEFVDVFGLACPSLSCNYVTEKRSGSYCEICDILLSNGIERHVSGNEHADSLKKYGCDNISLIDDCYFCACCECNINGCENVYRHVKGRKHLLRSETLAGERKLKALQKKINELETTDPGPEFSSVLYSITAEISRLMEQLKRTGFERMERDEEI